MTSKTEVHYNESGNGKLYYAEDSCYWNSLYGGCSGGSDRWAAREDKRDLRKVSIPWLSGTDDHGVFLLIMF